MESIKEMAESILSDLMNNIPISELLLKAKIFASKKGDQDLSNWIDHELNGYKEKPPVYRMLDAGVKINICNGFQKITNFEYPIDLVKEESMKKCLCHFIIFTPISEIEITIHELKSGTLTRHIPASFWNSLQNGIYGEINGKIEGAYQYANVTALCNIPVRVKSLLIDYFLKIDKNEEINFASLMQKNNKGMTVNTTYNAAVLNIGSGSVNASNATNIIGDNNILISNIKELKQILDKIEESIKPLNNKECNDVIEDAKGELNKQNPSKKVLGNFLQKIKDIVSKTTEAVATTEIVKNVIPLITKALTLL
ncbi:MAG: hypothetical protein LKE74_11195 [Prevotella sp.]|jgi:hypothetical protein|nr:hypothetical protein [Prevotella sp.]MCH4018989.1 hypothetical protein [Prevotella sp.]